MAHDITRKVDVAVVGAGPAGAAAAYASAAGGLKTLLIEKADPPRYKTCGGGLLQRAAAMLPVDISPCVQRACSRLELHFLTSGQLLQTCRPEPIVQMVMRDQFDALLTRAAVEKGAALLTQAKVMGVQERPDVVELETEQGMVVARLVIAADGVNSFIARQCGFADGRRTIPALELEITVDDPTFARLNVARFDFDIVPLGYGWVFPKRNHLSIGVVSMRQGGVNLNDTVGHYLRRLGVDRPLKLERHGYVIPISPRRGGFAKGRVLLAGDAAGLVDPVTGEGITAAIASGQLAAQCIVQAQGEAAPAAAAYNTAVKRQWLPELRAARKLAYFLYECPRTRNWLFRRHGQRLSRAMMQVVSGDTTYRALLASPLNYLRLLS